MSLKYFRGYWETTKIFLSNISNNEIIPDENFPDYGRSTPHTTNYETPSELFLKRKLRTRMDLIKPDVNKSVCGEQIKQKSHHDSHSKSCEYFISQKVQVHNFHTRCH